MVYDWEAHKDVIVRLYTEEGFEVEDIIEYMRKHHNFTPSKRTYQTQFRRWNLPSKYHPALKNDALVARVKELWSRNLSHADMLQALHDEGFSIKSRELHRVRTTHRWLLRSSTLSGADDTAQPPHGNALTVPGAGLNNHLLMGSGVGPVAAYMPDLADARRRQMEAESTERWITKRRRRRTRQYAEMPADPPGPPRFPSETTLGSSQKILGLDKAAYADARQQFQSICESLGITKKTVAGPDAWGDAKNNLISRVEALRNAFWVDKANLEEKELALDVLCCDVTKRMRESEKPMSMTEVKNVLGLDPDKTRQARAVFYKILEAEGCTSKVALGSERWHALKQKWVDECDILQRTLSRLEDPQVFVMKHKAMDALATDVIKRLRDDQSKRKDNQANSGTAAAAAASASSLENLDLGAPAGSMEQLPGDPSGFADLLVPNQSHHVHPPRMLPDHLLDAQMAMQIPMDAALDNSLLLDPNAQGGFMDSHQQFMTDPAQLSAGASSFAATQATSFQTATPNSTLVPIYLRELANLGPIGDLWIGFLSMPSPSLEELRQVAAQKIPGSTCTAVEGLVKVPGMGGQSVGLPIHDDAQLAAHLSQEGPPTFHVRLTNLYGG